MERLEEAKEVGGIKHNYLLPNDSHLVVHDKKKKVVFSQSFNVECSSAWPMSKVNILRWKIEMINDNNHFVSEELFRPKAG